MTRRKPDSLRSARWFAPEDLRSFGHRSRLMPQFVQNAHPLNPHLPNMVGEAFTLHQALDINVPIGCGDAPVWAGNLLVVLCSDHDATPVVNTGTLYN